MVVLGEGGVSSERGTPVSQNTCWIGGGEGRFHAPCTINPTLEPAPYTLHPTPYTLHPAPHTLHPTTYTLQLAPYTLHPTPYTLRRIAPELLGTDPVRIFFM